MKNLSQKMNISALKNPNRICLSILNRYFSWLPDETFLRLKYRFIMGFGLNLKNPKKFTEKIQCLKLNDRNPLYTTMVDKNAVKDYVKSIIGEEFIIPTLAVWDSTDDIKLDSLPDKFVLKTTHGGGGGGVVICRDKNSFNLDEAKTKLNSSLQSDIYKYYREWPYKNVPRKIIAEQLLVSNDDNSEIRDYKLFCFNGKVRFLKVDFNRFKGHRANYYNTDWELLSLGEDVCMPDPNVIIERPEKLEEMISLAEIIAKDKKFVRVDFYFVNSKIYFGEITFYPASGMEHFVPDGWDEKLGDMLLI